MVGAIKAVAGVAQVVWRPAVDRLKDDGLLDVAVEEGDESQLVQVGELMEPSWPYCATHEITDACPRLILPQVACMFSLLFLLRPAHIASFSLVHFD